MDGPRVDSITDASDEALMLAYAGGAVAAFEQLYARHRGRLYRFLLRQLRDPALADEMFQDVWQRVISARASVAYSCSIPLASERSGEPVSQGAAGTNVSADIARIPAA